MNSPTDFKKGIEIQGNPEKTRADHLNAMEQKLIMLYNTLDGWDEFGLDRIPNVYNIQQKLLIYRDIYELLGELAGECIRFSLWCDAKKKGQYESFMLENETGPGTAKFKEIKAHVAGQKYRENRDYFKGLAELWERRRSGVLESINILKWMIRDLHESNRGN